MNRDDAITLMRMTTEAEVLIRGPYLTVTRVSGLDDVEIEVHDGKIVKAQYREDGGASLVKIKGDEFYK